MGDAPQRPLIIRYRKCPGCGYLETELSIKLARHNLKCLQCREWALDDFVATDDQPEGVE